MLAQEISAKMAPGIEDLLDKVLLQAEMLELTANPERELKAQSSKRNLILVRVQ